MKMFVCETCSKSFSAIGASLCPSCGSPDIVPVRKSSHPKGDEGDDDKSESGDGGRYLVEVPVVRRGRDLTEG